MISSQRNDNINTDEVGYMTRNNIAGISAHYNCLLFTPGLDFIQDPVSQPENSLEDFQIDSIQRCVAKHSKKCCFCHKAGATAVCGNKRCRRFGWYHFPCGLQNGAVQREIETNTGTAVVTYCFKCASGRRTEQRQESKEKEIERKGSKRLVKPIVIRKIADHHWMTTSQPAAQSSHNSTTMETETTSSQELFENDINIMLEPIDLNCVEQGLYEQLLSRDSSEDLQHKEDRGRLTENTEISSMEGNDGPEISKYNKEFLDKV